MKTTNFEQAVIAAIIETLGAVRGEQALASADLIEEGHLDSFAIMELTAHLEEELSIGIPPELLTPANFQSVASLAVMCQTLV
jgi:acyl carrier protein